LHTALAGREGHATYAPCDVRDLRTKRYDYWALGHVHSFEIVSTDPYVVFPGNIQGRNVRETGSKGAAMVEVADREVVSVQAVELDVIRWTRREVDCTDADPDRIRTLVRDALVGAQADAAAGRPLIVRLVLTGETEHAAELKGGDLALRDDCRALALAVSPELWIEKVQVRLQARHMDVPEEVPGDLAAIISEAATDPELAEALREDLAPFISSARAALGDAGDDDVLRAAVERGNWAKLIGEAASGLQPQLSPEN
jgi:DNA repair exonuclease SbcCD nuclease subunit